jgi:hypothetical protein
LDEIEGEDITNVTNSEIGVQSHLNRKATFSFGRADSIGDVCGAFLRPLAVYIAQCCNSNQRLSTRVDQAEAASIKQEEIMKMFGMMLRVIADPTTTLEEYVRSDRQEGLTIHRWGKIRSLLSFNVGVLVQKCNVTFQRLVTPGSRMSLDETIWACDAAWLGVRDHPEKPITRGVKVIHLGFRFANTARSYCWHFEPDRFPDVIKASEALDTAALSLPTPGTHIITADRWFGSIAWPQAHPQLHTVMALRENVDADIVKFMSRDLNLNEYRVFEWRNALISIHKSLDMNVVVSTAHRVVTPAPPATPAPTAILLGHPPRYTPEQAVDLAQLMLDTLQAMARSYGAPSSGTKAELIGRITGQPIPVPQPEDLGMYCLSVLHLRMCTNPILLAVEGARRFDTFNMQQLKDECRRRNLHVCTSRSFVILMTLTYCFCSIFCTDHEAAHCEGRHEAREQAAANRRATP